MELEGEAMMVTSLKLPYAIQTIRVMAWIVGGRDVTEGVSNDPAANLKVRKKTRKMYILSLHSNQFSCLPVYSTNVAYLVHQ